MADNSTKPETSHSCDRTDLVIKIFLVAQGGAQKNVSVSLPFSFTPTRGPKESIFAAKLQIMTSGNFNFGIWILAVTAVLVLGSCGQEAETTGEDEFGAGVKNEASMDIASLVNQLAEKDTIETTLLATVDEVCQKKGCWMTLHDQAGGEEMMVRFKDYGFFVPKDIGGRQVLVEGKAFLSMTSVEDLKHYAEDAGKSEEEINQITEPRKELSFEATGVKLLDN